MMSQFLNSNVKRVTSPSLLGYLSQYLTSKHRLILHVVAQRLNVVNVTSLNIKCVYHSVCLCVCVLLYLMESHGFTPLTR